MYTKIRDIYRGLTLRYVPYSLLIQMGFILTMLNIKEVNVIVLSISQINHRVAQSIRLSFSHLALP